MAELRQESVTIQKRFGAIPGFQALGQKKKTRDRRSPYALAAIHGTRKAADKRTHELKARFSDYERGMFEQLRKAMALTRSQAIRACVYIVFNARRNPRGNNQYTDKQPAANNGRTYE